MSNPATETLSVVVEREVAFPPEKIWRALTQPHLIEEWLMKNDFKTVVKMTFARGAALADPRGLFNSSLEGNTRRAIDFHEGDKIDEKALKALIRAAVALNTSVRATAGPVRSQKRPKSA